MSGEKNNKYRINITLEEWVDGQGFIVLERVTTTKQSELDAMTEQFRKQKNKLENNLKQMMVS